MLALVMCISVFTGCSKECTEHIDADLNGYCDECEEYVGIDSCEEHTDDDADGYCDVCDEYVGIDSCEEHTDDDADGYCDVCETTIE